MSINRILIAAAIVVGFTAFAFWDDPGQTCARAEESKALEAPARAEAAQGTESPSFEKQIRPIFQAKCYQCHGEKTQKAELDLSTQAGIAKGSGSGAIIVPGKPDESLLFEMVHEGQMPPKKEDRLSESEIESISRWIAGGAKYDNPEAGAAAALDVGVTEREIMPLMLLRCTVCHGLRRKEGELDLRTKASMLKGGKSGPAIVPGKPEESLVLKRIHAEEMPPRRRLVEVSIKVIEPAEVELLTKWIARGAPEAPPRGQRETLENDSEVRPEDREFWSFRSPQSPRVPNVRHAEQVRTPIDAFVLNKLEEHGLALSPDASKSELLRRAYFDLLGLPPSPEETEAYLADENPRAYEELLERLLASPRYGERWGRYWLDLAGYSDSDGLIEQDHIRGNAYRYRDYVIRSWNADKPYDRFLLEQIAGDELADHEAEGPFSEEIYDNLVATGFLRMAPDATSAPLNNFVPDRLEVVADELGVLTSSVMGLTMKCARCHAHKFDPLPHRDYYRLAAIFKGAFDENDWMKSGKADGDGGAFGYRQLKYLRAGEQESWEAEKRQATEEVERLRQPLNARRDELKKKHVEERLSKLPQVLHDDLRTLLTTPADKRNEVQKYLASKFEKELQIDDRELGRLEPDFRKLARETSRRIKQIETHEKSAPAIQALWDRGEPSATYILRRGNYLTPGREVEPGVPAVLSDGKTPFAFEPPWPGAKKTGRRLAFARWLTRPEHPLTSRVMVNRIWKHHFGNGIVKSLDNFGKMGQRPTHAELLDWLAVEFPRRGWSIKEMHRLIMTSSTYRQSSQVTPEHQRLDLDGTLLSRVPLRRMEAEVLRDTLVCVSGKLDETPFGYPDHVDARDDGLVTSLGTDKGWRRSIYVMQRRTQVPTLLEDFDLPQMSPNCVERSVATVAPQALHLLNNATINRLSEAFAERIAAEAGSSPERQVRRIYLVAFSRPPSAEELAEGVRSLGELLEKWRTSRTTSPDGVQDAPTNDEQAARRALATLCHAVMNSAEFLYLD